MQLQVRLVDAGAVVGGKAYVLCDAAGEMLPQQVACAVSCESGGVAEVTVKFVVDGASLRLSGEGAGVESLTGLAG